MVEELQMLPYQKPNNKLFYIIPLRLSIYNMAYNENKVEKKFSWWLKNKLGEPPVVFKEPLLAGTSKSMKNYMFNQGFLYNDVTTEIIDKKDKITVIYTITPNHKYTIDSIIFPKKVNELTKIIVWNQKLSLLKKGDDFNLNVLDDERSRVTDLLRNRGYFFFNKEYISFDIDTNAHNQKVNLTMVINPPRDIKGQRKFTLSDVYVFTDHYKEKLSTSLDLDTILYEDYHFITENNPFKPKSLLFGIYLKKGEIYSLQNHIKTQQKIMSFGAAKFVNIEYEIAKEDTNALNAYIFITPSKRQALSADVELNHSFQGFSGSALSFTYRNKNLTKRSDLFQFKTSFGIELNLFNKNSSIGLLNATDVSAEASYYLNRFIVPFPLKKVSKNSNVKTKFSLNYSYEQRFQRFKKHTTTFTAGYEWNETQTKKHFYNPISLSLLLIPSKDSIFQAQLDTITSLRYSFEENIIFGSNYTYLMTNKKGEDDRSYFKFRGDVYLAGNLIHALMLAIKSNSADSIPYRILNKDYAQFARFEGNFVYNNKIGNHSELVTRVNAGIIIPYGNSSVAPYFQQFFVGGANSIRAFRLRALGPGSYANEKSFSTNNFFDQSGDIKFEANVEYRFDLYKWFKWAFFIDAGNIWTLKADADRPGGAFTKDFYQSIAVGFGTGLRLDFSYFVIRTDLAMPVIDPRYPLKERWRLNQMDFKSADWRSRNLIFNLAIGYPF